MARWNTSNPHPTKINIFVRDGQWVAKHGDKEALAEFRVQRFGEIGSGVSDMGKFDALEMLCSQHPGLWDAGYVILEH